MAAPRSSRGFVTPLRGSRIGCPVKVMRCAVLQIGSDGKALAARSTAAAPATNGAENDVPQSPKVKSGVVSTHPGARRVVTEELFDQQPTRSAYGELSVHP